MMATNTLPRGTPLYYSLLKASPEMKRDVSTLFALCHHLQDIPNKVHEESVARAKLYWWQQELKDTYEGHPHHPFTQTLYPALQKHQLPYALFEELLSGILLKLEVDHCCHEEDFLFYCYREGSIRTLLASYFMDETPQENVSFSYDLGIFFAILHEIQELRHSIEKNRLYFPLTTLSRFELTLESLKKELSGKEKNPGLLPFLKEEATLARSYYEKALRALPSEKKRIYAPHLIHGALMMSLLDTLEKEGFNLLTHQTRLTPLQNYWIARKTFKRVKR